MTDIFRPSKFEIARLRKKLTYIEIAKRTGISTRELKRITDGEVQPKSETVKAISSALGFPLEFFLNSDQEIPVAATFRAQSSMTERERGAGLASGAIGGILSDWLEKEFDVPDPDVPDLSEFTPRIAAQTLRNIWGLSERPIGNMVQLLENRGVRVFSLSEESLRLNAFALWMGVRPFVFLNSAKSSESSRFDAAHELAHLCLHRDGQQGKEVEKEANEFASAFLMPEGDILARKVYPTLERLIHIKHRWKVSLSALVHRYCDLGLIKKDRAKWLYIEMSRKGFLKNEPSPIPREPSDIWTQVIQDLWKNRKSIETLANELVLPPDEIKSLVFLNRIGRIPEGPGARKIVGDKLRLVN